MLQHQSELVFGSGNLGGGGWGGGGFHDTSVVIGGTLPGVWATQVQRPKDPKSLTSDKQ